MKRRKQRGTPACPAARLTLLPSRAAPRRRLTATWRSRFGNTPLPLEPFVLVGTPDATAKGHTIARAAYDAKALYIALRCEEPNPGQLQSAEAGAQRWEHPQGRRGGSPHQRRQERQHVLSFCDQPQRVVLGRPSSQGSTRTADAAVATCRAPRTVRLDRRVRNPVVHARDRRSPGLGLAHCGARYVCPSSCSPHSGESWASMPAGQGIQLMVAGRKEPHRIGKLRHLAIHSRRQVFTLTKPEFNRQIKAFRASRRSPSASASLLNHRNGRNPGAKEKRPRREPPGNTPWPPQQPKPDFTRSLPSRGVAQLPQCADQADAGVTGRF